MKLNLKIIIIFKIFFTFNAPYNQLSCYVILQNGIQMKSDTPQEFALVSSKDSFFPLPYIVLVQLQCLFCESAKNLITNIL